MIDRGVSPMSFFSARKIANATDPRGKVTTYQ